MKPVLNSDYTFRTKNFFNFNRLVVCVSLAVVQEKILLQLVAVVPGNDVWQGVSAAYPVVRNEEKQIVDDSTAMRRILNMSILKVNHHRLLYVLQKSFSPSIVRQLYSAYGFLRQQFPGLYKDVY